MRALHLVCPGCGAKATVYGDMGVAQIACPQCSQPIPVPAHARVREPEPATTWRVADATSHPWQVVPTRRRAGTRSWERQPGSGGWWRLHEWPVGLQLLALLGLVAAGCLVVAWMRSAPTTTTALARDPEAEARRAAERERKRTQAAAREKKLLGRFLAAGRPAGPDRVLARWHAHAEGVTTLAFGPGGQTLATGGGDQRVLLWDLTTGAIKHTLRGHRHKVTHVVFSPDGKLLASAGNDHAVHLWEAATGKLVRVLRHDGRTPVERVAFAPDGRTLALGSHPDQAAFQTALSLWEVRTGKRKPVRFVGPALGGTDTLAFLPDGATLVTGGHPDGVFLWDVQTGRPRQVLPTGLDDVMELAVSPDGWTLAVAGPEASDTGDTVVRLLTIDNGEANTLGNTGDQPVHALAFSPDGKLLAAGTNGQVRLWEVETLRELPALPDKGANGQALAFSPGGTLFAVSHGDDVVLWRTADLDEDPPGEH